MAKGKTNNEKATDAQTTALENGAGETTTTGRAARIVAALPGIDTVDARSHLLRSTKRTARTITIHGVDDDGRSIQIGEFDHADMAELFASAVRDQKRFPVVNIQSAGK